jgi:hypothetical protein
MEEGEWGGAFCRICSSLAPVGLWGYQLAVVRLVMLHNALIIIIIINIKVGSNAN